MDWAPVLANTGLTKQGLRLCSFNPPPRELERIEGLFLLARNLIPLKPL